VLPIINFRCGTKLTQLPASDKCEQYHMTSGKNVATIHDLKVKFR